MSDYLVAFGVLFGTWLAFMVAIAWATFRAMRDDGFGSDRDRDGE